MWRLGILFIIFVVLGCSGGAEKRKLGLEYTVESYSNKRIERDKGRFKPLDLLVKKGVSGVIKEEKYKIDISGEMVFDVLVKYIVDVLGLVYYGGVEGVSDKKIDCEISGEFTLKESIEILKKFGDNIGCSVDLDKGVVNVVLGSAGVDGLMYCRYVGLEYVGNAVEQVGNSVRIVRVGQGVVLIGQKSNVIAAVEILRILDVDMFKGIEVVLVPYSLKVCDKVKEIIANIEGVKVIFVSVSSDSTIMVLRDNKYKNYILSLLEGVSREDSGNYYLVPVNNSNLDLVEESLKTVFPAVIYVVAPNGLIFSDYDNYIKIKKFLEKIDVLERQLHVRLYLLDIQKSDVLSVGGDIDVRKTSFSVTSQLREAVGLGVVGSWSKFQVFLNFLIQKLDGRVLSSPSMILKNRSTADLNFGQRIPVTKTRTQNAAGPALQVIQDIEYINIGLGVNMTVDLVGDYVYTDLNIFNSSVLPTVGVEGNPQFANDSVKLQMVVKKGSVAIIAGLKRNSVEKRKSWTLIPQLLSKRKDNREFLLCMAVDEVGAEQDQGDLVKKLCDLVQNN